MDMSGWTFEQLPDDQWSQLMSPSIDPIDISTGYQNNVGANYFNYPGSQGGGMGAGFQMPQTPMFNPASVGSPSQAGAPQMAGTTPSAAPIPSTSPLGGTATFGSSSTASAPTTTPGRGGLGAAAAANKPGSTGAGFDWMGLAKGLGAPLLNTGLQFGLGAGMSAMGQKGNDQPRPQAAPAGPAPAPTTPTGAPNAGPPTPPLPGAQWSPLLMGKTPQVGPNAGLEAQKRMRRGGQTGGMALY